MKALILIGLLCLSFSSFAQRAPHAQGKVVIYIEALLKEHTSGLKDLIKAAEKSGVLLEYEASPLPPAGEVDFAIKITTSTKKILCQYVTESRYILIDSRNEVVVEQSGVLRTESESGACARQQEYETQSQQKKDIGVTRKAALIKLMDFAVASKKN